MQTIWEISKPEDTEPSTRQAGSGSPSGEFFISPLAGQLLKKRSLQNSDEIKRFLFPQLEHLHDPFQMKGVQEAVDRILIAVQKRELILIHGDYDVDGI